MKFIKGEKREGKKQAEEGNKRGGINIPRREEGRNLESAIYFTAWLGLSRRAAAGTGFFYARRAAAGRALKILEAMARVA